MLLQNFGHTSLFSSCYQSSKDTVISTMFILKDIKQSPDAFQKICLVALSAIRALNFHCNTKYLPDLIHVLDSAPAFDFYPVFRLPSYFLHPYCAERFDEEALLNQLEVILCNNWGLGILDSKGSLRQVGVHKFAKEELGAFLDWMVEERVDFSSEEEVKIVLQNWFKNRLQKHPKKTFSPDAIHLDDLKVDLKYFSSLQKMMMSGFMFADIACVPDFLQTWQIIDLVPCAKRIGSLPLFSWVPHQVLGDWVWRGLCMGFIFQFVQAAQEISKGDLSAEKKREAKWLMVASAAECALCVSNLLNCDYRLINGLALIAKSLGVIVFLVTPKATFFVKE